MIADGLRAYAAEQVAQAKNAAQVFADEKCRHFLERAEQAEAAVAQARGEEREACAEIVERSGPSMYPDGSWNGPPEFAQMAAELAAAIRART